jgi:nicotinate-nucleotide--dimethylbenzimidazole phosphoribosyltransferase
MAVSRSLIAPTSNPLLQRALSEKLQRRAVIAGSLGELEPLALRLGLMQNTLTPRFSDPQMLIFAADHGLAVDGIVAPPRQQTHEQAQRLLDSQLPATVFARNQDIALTVVDCGMAEDIAAHEYLLMRKIAHGTRNARITDAMTLDQAHAARWRRRSDRLRRGRRHRHGYPGIVCPGRPVPTHRRGGRSLRVRRR